MADRSVRVVLSADTGRFAQGMEKAKASVDSFMKRVDDNRGSLDIIGGTFTKVGLAASLGLGLVTKSAMDWESAWAGVTKTVDGSSAQLAKLEGDLRQMAKTMPAAHTEIAAVAEAAGQLGVKTDDVAAFTKVMIDLGETTNLTADEAATSFAQFMNVMGSSADEVDNLGSALVALGNNGASTERDILSMAQRIAAAGKTVGMTESDVLGFASALSSVGVEAEAGGTAISMTFTQIAAAVRKGGAELDLIATTSGMSAAQFAQAWESRPAEAMSAFVAGLGALNRSGGDAYGTMEKLGMSGIRQTDSLMRLANATGLLDENLANASSAMSANSALVEEAAKRYETTESKIKIAFNNMQDSAIQFGGVILPVVAQAAQGAADLASAFGGLPAPIQQGMVAMTGLVAAVGLGGGALAKGVSTALELREAWRSLVPSGSALEGKLRGVGAAAGVAAGALALIAVGQIIHSFNDFALSVGDAEVALRKLAQAGSMADLDKAFDFTDSAINVQGFGDALTRVASATSGWDKVRGDIQGVMGMGGDIQQAREQFAQLDAALSQMDAGEAAAAFEKISATAKDLNVPMSTLADLFPEYAARLQEAQNASGGTVTAMDALAASTDEAATSAATAAQEQERLTQAMMDMANQALALSGTQMGLEAAFDAATEALRTNGATLDITTEKGRANQGALDQVASAALRLVDAQRTAGVSGDDMAASMTRARAQFIATATGMGMTTAAAEALADSYGLIPSSVSTQVAAPGSTESKAKTDAFHAALMRLPAEKRSAIQSIFNSQGVDAANRALNALNGKTVNTYVRTNYINVGGSMRAAASGGWIAEAKMKPVQPARMAGGGFHGRVYGPGSWTSDSVGPVMLSRDEFVVRAARAQLIERMRPGFLDSLNGHGPLPRMAEGGFVRDYHTSAGVGATAGRSAELTVRVVSPIYLDSRQIGEAIRDYTRSLL